MFVFYQQKLANKWQFDQLAIEKRDILNEEFKNIENHTINLQKILFWTDQGNRSTASKHFGGKVIWTKCCTVKVVKSLYKSFKISWNNVKSKEKNIDSKYSDESDRESKNESICVQKIWSKDSLVNWQLNWRAWANSGQRAENYEKCELIKLTSRFEYSWRTEDTDEDKLVTCVTTDKVLTQKVSFEVKQKLPSFYR